MVHARVSRPSLLKTHYDVCGRRFAKIIIIIIEGKFIECKLAT